MDKKDFKADYYFSPDKKILERAEEENEFEGAIVEQKDMDLITKINDTVSTAFWRDIWIRIAFSGVQYEIEVKEETRYGEKIQYKYLHIINPQFETMVKFTPYSYVEIWREDTEGANKKGWDWSGDTYVYVHELSGPSSINNAVILVMLNKAKKGIFTHYLTDDDPSQPYADWESLWLDRIGYCDLPKWSAAPKAVVFLNGCITIAQKASNVYMVISKYSS